MMSTKANKALVQARIADLARVRLDGLTTLDLAEYVRSEGEKEGSPWARPEGEPPFSERTLRRYAAAADKLIADTIDKDREKQFSRHVALRRSLFARAVNAGELSVALSVLKDECALLALYPPTKTALTDPSGTREFGGLSHDERVQKVCALLGISPPGHASGPAAGPGQAAAGE
jgi:hypothetical protein